MAGEKVSIINWSENGGGLVWQLITELEKPGNLLGKKDQLRIVEPLSLSSSRDIGVETWLVVDLGRLAHIPSSHAASFSQP
jgi:hypothetical protein